MVFSPMIFYDVPSFSMAYQAIPARSATARCKISLSNKLLDNVTKSLGTPYISWGKPWFTLDFPFNQSSDNEFPSCKKYRHAHTHTVYTYIHN